MPDHPSWPAELVEKGARAIRALRTAGPPGFPPDPSALDPLVSAQAVLSALSGDLVPRSQAVVFTDDHEVCDGQLTEARSQADALAEALEEAIENAGTLHVVEEGPNAGWVDVPGDRIGYFNDDDVCTADCPACKREKLARSALASYRSKPASGETE